MDADRQIFARMQAAAAEEERARCATGSERHICRLGLTAPPAGPGAREIQPLRQLAKQSRRRHANYDEIAAAAAGIVNLHESLILSAAATPDTDDRRSTIDPQTLDRRRLSLAGAAIYQRHSTLTDEPQPPPDDRKPAGSPHAPPPG